MLYPSLPGEASFSTTHVEQGEHTAPRPLLSKSAAEEPSELGLRTDGGDPDKTVPVCCPAHLRPPRPPPPCRTAASISTPRPCALAATTIQVPLVQSNAQMRPLLEEGLHRLLPQPGARSAITLSTTGRPSLRQY